MKKKTIMIVVLLAVFVGAGLTLVQLGAVFSSPAQKKKHVEAPETRKQSIRVEKVQAAMFEKRVCYPGTICAAKQSQLAFRVGGPLIRVAVNPGDRVKAGQLLMQIDPKDFEDGIRVLEAQLQGARARGKNAEQDFFRIKNLFRGNVVSRADFDHAAAASRSSRATVNQIQAQLAQARHQLAYTRLTSPFDGIITDQLIENHEMVRPGQVVVKLHDISELDVTINVPENEIIHHAMTVGEKGVVTFPGVRNRSFPANFKEWNSQADPQTRTYAVTFVMAAPDDVRILPGMTAEVAWADESADRREVAVPVTSIVNFGNDKSFVWRFDPVTRKAQAAEVVTGHFKGSSRITILSGLKPGDHIVSGGMDFITPDTPLGEMIMINQNSAEIN